MQLAQHEKPSTNRLAAIARQFAAQRIITIGDLVADQFLYGEIARVSREAPVFILRHERTDTLPGGAANCAANLAALGAQTFLIGCVGDDEPGRALLAQLRRGKVDCAGVLTLPDTRTTTKVRILAGQTHSTRQQVIRVDYEEERSISPNSIDQLHHRLDLALASADAVIVSDYNYGVADRRIISALQRAARSERRIPVTVDSRFRLKQFENLTSATPNQDEVEHACGGRLSYPVELEAAAQNLRSQLRCEALLITRGPQGMLLQTADASPYYIDAVGAREPVDVTGAGDTVIATYTLALASGASFVEAAHLANFAGGLAVMKRGTASISSEELLSSIAQYAS